MARTVARSILAHATSAFLGLCLVATPGAHAAAPRPRPAPAPAPVPAPAPAPPPVDARTATVWEPAGPVSTSAGMTAVATDPDHPKVLWLGSATTVWVSDDEGQTFHLVLQLSRASGLLRETGSQPAEDPTELEDDPEEQQRLEEEIEDEGLDEDDLFLLDTGDTRPVREGGDTEDGSTDEDDLQPELRFGVVRLRVFGDTLYVCTSRGLYTVSRAARRVGTGRELRFGRKVAVNDVAVTGDGVLWIATDGGLAQLGADGIGRPARGLEEDLAVRALTVSEGRLVAATSRGLRIASLNVDGYDRISLGGREDAGLEDVMAEANSRLLVAGADQVARVVARPTEVPFVEDAWNVPGAARLAVGRGGARWAVGMKGAWRLTPGETWQRVSDGLFDRRMLDVATGYGPLAQLWAVGRSGAWRLVPESGRAYSSSAERLADQALEGYPNDGEVLAWAVAARGVNLDQIDSWALEERLAWLLPRVELRGRWDRRRQEDFLLIPILDRRLLDAAEVRPIGDELRIMAYWDIMPAITAALEGTRSVFESSRIRARRELERVREVIMPLYQTWARKRIELAVAEGLSTSDLIKETLALERLESDLHVYTGGRFPVGGTPKQPKKKE